MLPVANLLVQAFVQALQLYLWGFAEIQTLSNASLIIGPSDRAQEFEPIPVLFSWSSYLP